MDSAHARAPARTSVEVIGLDAIEDASVRTGVAYWRMLKAGRAMPSRAELSPRAMTGILRNVALLRVLDGGADYDYRIAGDAHVQAYGKTLKGARLSDVVAELPQLGQMLRGVFDHVRATAAPFAARGWIGREIRDARFVYHESCFLPLAGDGVTVDHILAVAVHVPKASA